MPVRMIWKTGSKPDWEWVTVACCAYLWQTAEAYSAVIRNTVNHYPPPPRGQVSVQQECFLCFRISNRVYVWAVILNLRSTYPQEVHGPANGLTRLKIILTSHRPYLLTSVVRPQVCPRPNKRLRTTVFQAWLTFPRSFWPCFLRQPCSLPYITFKSLKIHLKIKQDSTKIMTRNNEKTAD